MKDETGAPPLSGRVVAVGVRPRYNGKDALHIAVAAVNGVSYLVTWNCTHIANAAIRYQIETLCRASGYVPPVLCTPEELMEE